MVWLAMMITVNLQTSFLTPPFGWALFFLKGVAPAGVTTRHIYLGVLPSSGCRSWASCWCSSSLPSRPGCRRRSAGSVITSIY